MTATAKFLVSAVFTAMLLGLSGCAPEVGSEKWCANLKEKPKGDWSANEVGNYAKHCIFK